MKSRAIADSSATASTNMSLWYNGITSVSKTADRGSIPWRFANVRVAEWSNATVCKTVKPSVQIRPFTPTNAGLIQW